MISRGSLERKLMPDINLRKAKSIIRGTLSKGKELELKPLSVVVLDAGGHVIAFEREAGAAPGRFAIAQAKAFGSIMPVPGGVLLRDKKGGVVGAVGVTGDTSDNDLIAAMAGIEGSGLVGEG